MLSVLAFSMSMVGTFLVRSGILTSVHSFAVDPERGIFILALLAIYIGGALALFAMRIGTVSEGSRFDMVSREAALVVNNLLLTVILVIVLAGTLYPLMLEAMSGDQDFGRRALFQRNCRAGRRCPAGAAGCRAAAALAQRSAAASARPDGGCAVLRARQCWCCCAAFAGRIGMLPLLGLVVAAVVAVGKHRAACGSASLRRTPLFTWGMVLAHLGCAVSIAGMACDSAFTQENMVAMAAGETRAIGPFDGDAEGCSRTARPELPGARSSAVSAQGRSGRRSRCCRSSTNSPTRR